MRDDLLRAVETLRNLYYLVQNLRDEGREHIDELRRHAELVPEERVPQALDGVHSELQQLKRLVGCRLSDEEINKAVKWLTSQGDGYPCVSKRRTDRGFDNYAWVFPRWPHIPGHALVQYDSNIGNVSPNKIFLTEERLFRDVKLLWSHISHLSDDGG